MDEKIERLRLGWFVSFVRTFDCGSYDKAAQKLGCEPTTVADHVRELGNCLGKDLVGRGSTVAKTDIGYKLIPLARSVIRLARAHRTNSATLEIGDLRFVWLYAYLLQAKLRKHQAVAEELGCSRSVVTRYLKSLDSWIGEPLIGSARPFSLTDKGKAFRRAARTMLRMVDGVREDSLQKEWISAQRHFGEALDPSSSYKQLIAADKSRWLLGLPRSRALEELFVRYEDEM